MSSVAVIGSGPNGLTAAAVAARAGLNVAVYEANETLGGAARTQSLNGSRARFDLGSAVHPMALQSPAFRELGIDQEVEFIIPEMSFAHVLGSRTAHAWRDISRTVEELGGPEAAAYSRLVGPLSRRMEQVSDILLNPLVRLPRDPLTLAVFGASSAAGMLLKDAAARRLPLASALYAGACAHVAGGSRGVSNAGAGLFLAAAAHHRGWPVPRGGSQAISDALATQVRRYSGVLHTGRRIENLADIPEEIVLFDTSPEDAARIAGDRLPPALHRTLSSPRRSPGSCVVHLVLSEPVPWTDPQLNRTATVHLGGTAREIGIEERLSRTKHSASPFVIVTQPSLFDDSRAPAGRQVLWAYSHVPLGSDRDLSGQIIDMIERAAPGFKDVILEHHVVTAEQLQRQNAALVGGDITGGTMDLLGSIKRPRISPDPWYLQTRGLYLVSSATPPGPAVHGMGGYLGAKSMLRREFGFDGN